MHHDITPTDDDIQAYGALIMGGPNGIACRIIAAKPHKFSASTFRRMRALLDAGYSLEVITPSQQIWDANKHRLYAALGLKP